MKNTQTKNCILRVLQGAIIGAGAILPGISGGVLAVIFGIYRPAMELLTHPKRAFPRYWRMLLAVGIGWVLGFLGGLDHPTPLRASEVNRILGKVDEMEVDAVDAEIPFVEGESVKVSDGPFSGFTGVIEKVDAEKKKVTVTVKVFGRSTGLDLGFTQIEKE